MRMSSRMMTIRATTPPPMYMVVLPLSGAGSASGRLLPKIDLAHHLVT
jgi:hypothetical protein